jgi:hypothetical protein
MYLQALNRNSDSTTGDDATGEDDSGGVEIDEKKKQIANIVQNTLPATQHYTVYLKSRKLPTEVDDATKDFLKNKLEFETKVSFRIFLVDSRFSELNLNRKQNCSQKMPQSIWPKLITMPSSWQLSGMAL